ncbi:type II toxin-antitoxin system RelE/ParE family toxin [uncultured Arcticibacterium sp.]|uniref:type II toxin-antitoxin system RelE/ParE family toxin n=1 Tax=uncultured Arcticibacterium sp. TaxID=2173042 RepID=UPI0030FAF416
MAKFNLTNKAVEDLGKIWDYTFDEWSERQADIYYKSFISTCNEIAINPRIGKSYEGITESLFGMKVNHHIIFYRILSEDYIEVTRILHERMDLKNRLKD